MAKRYIKSKDTLSLKALGHPLSTALPNRNWAARREVKQLGREPAPMCDPNAFKASALATRLSCQAWDRF